MRNSNRISNKLELNYKNELNFWTNISLDMTFKANIASICQSFQLIFLLVTYS